MGVKSYPVHPQGLGEQDFGIEAGSGQTFFFKPLIRPANESQDGPYGLSQRIPLIARI